MKKKTFFVLMFHGIVSSKPEHFIYRPSTNCFVRERDFEKVVRFCSKKYKILHLSDLETYFNGTATEDGILITFDDGLQSLIKLGLPILEKYGATATVFITSDWTNQAIQPAVFSLEYYLYHELPASVKIVAKNLSFERQVNSKKEITAALDKLWTILFAKKISPLSLTAEQILINNKPLNSLDPEPGGGEWKAVPWQALKKAHAAGTIEIGAHGKTHTPFTWLSKEELANELTENKKQIADNLQINVNACSFPHGLYNDGSLAELSKHFVYGFANNIVASVEGAEKINISRYNVPFQRPNNVSSLIGYPLAGKVLRKMGAVSGLF